MIHEVFLDHSNNFQKVRESVEDYKRDHINAMYLMGALERDNQVYQSEKGIAMFKDKDAPPLACVDRSRINQMLGGEMMFKSLVRKCKEEEMKVIIDSFQRVSSSRHHRKYKEQCIHYLDYKGHQQLCYGIDGRSNDYEDTI